MVLILISLISSEIEQLIGKVCIFYTKFAFPISFSISYTKYCPLSMYVSLSLSLSLALSVSHSHPAVLSTAMYALEGRNIDVFSILNVKSDLNKVLNKYCLKKWICISFNSKFTTGPDTRNHQQTGLCPQWLSVAYWSCTPLLVSLSWSTTCILSLPCLKIFHASLLLSRTGSKFSWR